MHCTVLRNMQCRCLHSHRSLEVPHQTRRLLRHWTIFTELQVGCLGNQAGRQAGRQVGLAP